MTRYHGAYAEWRQDPEGFWAEAAKAIDWDVPPAQILATAEAPSGRWFEGAQCNTCYNCVDRHVRAGHGARAAIRYDSPVTGTKDVYSYDRLLAEVSALASVLRARGVGRGDRVLIYMPMVPEALVAMLASARLGAVHSVVFGGFSAEELALRDVVVIFDTDPAGRSDTRLRLRPRGFMLALMGKDGAIKARKPSPWDVRELSRSIDKMPMRQQEMQDRRGVDQ